MGDERIVYRRGEYFVGVRRSSRAPATLSVYVDYVGGYRKIWVSSYCLDERMATTAHISRWRRFFGVRSVEDALERARAIVDSYADASSVTEERIRQKMTELQLRQQAIEELEDEEKEKRGAWTEKLESPPSNPAATEAA